jgi:hypothetical protein
VPTWHAFGSAVLHRRAERIRCLISRVPQPARKSGWPQVALLPLRYFVGHAYSAAARHHRRRGRAVHALPSEAAHALAISMNARG